MENEIEFDRKCSDFVQREILCCVSNLVHTLAQAYTGNGSSNIENLCEEAAELSYPVEDWEEAAIQAGWVKNLDGQIAKQDGDELVLCADWQEACEQDGLDHYQWEVFEYWAVSSWLAEKLTEKGERVGELGDLTVWGRTTTGQAISMDSVIREIVRELGR